MFTWESDIKIDGGKTVPSDGSFLQLIQQVGDFRNSTYESTDFLQDEQRFTKLPHNEASEIHIAALMQNLLPATAAGLLAKAYRVEFPKGVPHTLIKLKQGGFGSMIHHNGRFVGSASFYSMAPHAAVLGFFTALSIASSQYFLTQINHEMRIINMKLDDILEFLYGDKKAGLAAEMSFVRQSFENFSSIMSNDFQRIATITNLQQAKKVAMKDIEFYIHDLGAVTNSKSKDYDDLIEKKNKLFQIKDSLELAQQLYITSVVMEVFFSQNQNEEYLKFVQKDMFAYIQKCDKRILSHFAELKGAIGNYKPKALEKVDKSADEKQIEKLIVSLNEAGESPLYKAVQSVFHVSNEPAEYYLSENGELYMRA